MKKTICILTIAMLIAGGMFTGCQSSATKVENAQEDVTAANAALNKAISDSIAEFKKNSEVTISQYDKEIIKLREKASTMNQENKILYEKRITEIEKKNAQMKKELREAKIEGQKQWREFKAEFTHDMDELGLAFKDLTVKNID